MIQKNTIVCDDCLVGMASMPDDSVDITVTSPPYNMGKTYRGKEMNLYDEYSDDRSQDEYYLFIKKVLSELIRVTKHYVFFNFQLLTNNKDAYLRILSDFRPNIKDVVVWHKKQWQPSIAPTCLSSAFEFVFVFTKPEKAVNRSFERANFNNRVSGQQQCNVIHGHSASIKECTADRSGENKAVFPEYFARWFIDLFSEEGDLVFDPFMGTATTAFVARSLKRDYFGFELSQKYCDLADKRMKQTVLRFDGK